MGDSALAICGLSPLCLSPLPTLLVVAEGGPACQAAWEPDPVQARAPVPGRARLGDGLLCAPSVPHLGATARQELLLGLPLPGR